MLNVPIEGLIISAMTVESISTIPLIFKSNSRERKIQQGKWDWFLFQIASPSFQTFVAIHLSTINNSNA